MKILGREVALGMSVSSHRPEQIRRFAELGFTHFEVGIPARLPSWQPSCSGRSEEEPFGPSPELCAEMACRGEEERLVSLQEGLVAAIAAEGLCPWSVHLPFGFGWDIAHREEAERDAAVAALRRVIDLTAAWRPRVYVLHGCLEPVAPEDRAVRMARSIQSLRELDAWAQRRGARIALEDLPRSCLGNSALETRAMMLAASVPVCFDVNHLLGDTHAAFLEALAPHVVTTHLSDYDGADERHWLPGEGIVPWREVFFGLLDAGYRGPFLFELRAGENGSYEADEVLAAFRRALGDA